MISKSLKSLLGRVGRLNQLTMSTLVGGLVALSVPVLSWLLGAVLVSLIDAQMAPSETGRPRLAQLLPEVHSFFPDSLPPLAQVSFLLATALVLLVLTAGWLYVFYRLVHNAAVDFEVALIAQLRDHAKRLATVRTLSAQQTALTDCLNYHLPRVRGSLSRWWRTFPRHLIQLVACVVLAFLIQPMLCLLSLIATALVTLLYRLLDRLRRTTLPVVRERASQEREGLVAMSLKGPLLESVHDQAEIENRFADQLAHYRKDAFRSLTSSTWKTPTLLLAGGGLTCLFLFVIAVQILRSETTFSVPGAFTLCLCFGGAAVSALRLQRSWRDLHSVDTAAEEVERFLALQIEEFDSEDLQTVSAVSQQVELEHVTVRDSSGRKLLENASVVFKPGMLVGVLGSQGLQAHALVELLMGYGRPVSGRMLVDGILTTDLDPRGLAKCSHWVAGDGALVAGSVQDNLLSVNHHRDGPGLSDAVAGAKLTETLQQLPDGLSTLISPGDDRLTADAAFRIGIARAALTAASILVLEEPAGHQTADTEQQTLEAIRSLVSYKRITVVLPQRLLTLRQCDLVIMLHDHQVVDSGTHAELLQRNELYRHLNYLRFNPFRSLPE